MFADSELSAAPIVMAVKVATVASANQSRQRSVGVAFVDPTTRDLGVADFVDDDLFSNLEVSLLSTLPRVTQVSSLLSSNSPLKKPLFKLVPRQETPIETLT